MKNIIFIISMLVSFVSVNAQSRISHRRPVYNTTYNTTREYTRLETIQKGDSTIIIKSVVKTDAPLVVNCDCMRKAKSRLGVSYTLNGLGIGMCVVSGILFNKAVDDCFSDSRSWKSETDRHRVGGLITGLAGGVLFSTSVPLIVTGHVKSYKCKKYNNIEMY